MAEPVLDLAELQITLGKTGEMRDTLARLLAREDLPAAQRARAEALLTR
jgi:hypothetical protein